MTHSHNHGHRHHPGETSTFRLFVTMMMNFIITLVEVVGGIMAGSLSLISDALHNFSDGIAIIISYIAIRLNKQAKTEKYTFGLKRAEILAAVINAVTLIVISIYLFKESYHRLISPEPIKGSIMIAVASIGLAANIIGTLLLREGSKSSMNIRSAYLHLLSDAVSSIAVIIGGIAIYFWQINWIDPILTVLIAIYVLRESVLIIWEATNILMMGTPKSVSLSEIQKAVQAIPGVLNIHHVHVWGLNERNIHFESHVDVDDIKVSETSKLSGEIETLLKEKFHIEHVTLQFECGDCEIRDLVLNK